MALNLLEFGTGGGGLYGQDRDVILQNFRFAEHSFVKHGADKVSIEKTYPPGCMLLVDIQLEDPEPDEQPMQTQAWPVGNLPYARLQELGQLEGADPKKPGGYQPSLDGDDKAPGAVEGPFVIGVGKSDIWSGAPYSILMGEFKQLGVGEHAERLAAEGVAALNGTRAHLGVKALPKSNKTLQTEQQTGVTKDARTILVPTKINAWPEAWGGAQKPAAPKAASAPKPAAAATAAPAAAKPVAAPAASAPASGNGIDDEKVAGYVKQAITKANGVLEKKAAGVIYLQLMNKEGAARTAMMQRANSNDFLKSRAAKGDWQFDESTETLVNMQ